ncbi:MAG: Maf family protein [Steroidobacteraceae bacterium]
MPPLILASTSPYRRALLLRLGLPFEARAPQVDESAVGIDDAAARASHLALAKAEAVAAAAPDAAVIGSDQVALLGKTLLGKPGSIDNCRRQLAAASGHRISFFTAVAVVAASRSYSVAHLDRTDVMVRRLGSDEIDRYIERERPLDCAGGFKAEAAGICLFDSIDSHDPTALIGLPLIWLSGVLRELGYQLP